MKTPILIPVFIVVLAFTCRTVHASGVVYSAKPNPDQVVSVPASSTTVSYFDAGTIAPPNNNVSLVSGVINSSATPINEFILHNIAPAIVPEPSTLILTGFGFMGLLVYGRCWKNQSKANA
jgi:hypothetical protein